MPAKLPISLDSPQQVEYSVNVKDLGEFTLIGKPLDGMDLLGWWYSPNESATVEQIFRRVIDWKDVIDQNGKPVPFRLETLLKLCGRFPELRAEVIKFATSLLPKKNEESTTTSDESQS